MVRGGQSMAAVTKILGHQPEDAAQLGEGRCRRQAERRRQAGFCRADGIARLRVELARMTMERDILKNIPKGRAPAQKAETLVGATLSAVEGSGRWLPGETSR